MDEDQSKDATTRPVDLELILELSSSNENGESFHLAGNVSNRNLIFEPSWRGSLDQRITVKLILGNRVYFFHCLSYNPKILLYWSILCFMRALSDSHRDEKELGFQKIGLFEQFVSIPAMKTFKSRNDLRGFFMNLCDWSIKRHAVKLPERNFFSPLWS